ncbi:PfkB family carbohydrate kinase [Agromyces sp. ZXT2-3]|uniref:PfkB family carbohydrate kinase n=1 Tax=Agromyces sp. ZXT2-3 TaxID=3461152 RepID=UPI004054C4E3
MSHSAPDRTHVVVVGDALIDELRDPTGSREFVGGAALNVAVGLSLLGERTTLVAMLGDDEPAARIRAFLAGFGVALVESPSALGTSRAVSDRSDGEPRYEFNAAAQHRRLSFAEPTRTVLSDADLVVVSCFPFDDDDQVDALLGAIDDSERRLVVDGNPRAGMLRDRERFLANFERVAGRSLLVKAGDEDAALLAGESLARFVDRLRASAGPSGGGDDHRADRADRTAVAYGADAEGPAVLATAGREGAAVHHRDLDVRAGIVQLPGPVVDTMGAGDATLAAVVHRVAQDGLPGTAAEWTRALDEAMTIAAATVRHEGALLRTVEEAPRVVA